MGTLVRSQNCDRHDLPVCAGSWIGMPNFTFEEVPADPPVVDGYSLAGWCEPAQQVGGDLYDFFPLPDGP